MRRFLCALAVVLTVAALGCSNRPCPELEANKALVERFGELINNADWDGLAETMVEDFVRHSDATAGPPITSRDAFIELQKAFLASMPDQRITLKKVIAEGEYVAALATYSGTQTGPMGDFPITGNFAEVDYISMFRIEDGKVAELWVEWDNLAIFTQLGLFPPPAPGTKP